MTPPPPEELDYSPDEDYEEYEDPYPGSLELEEADYDTLDFDNELEQKIVSEETFADLWVTVSTCADLWADLITFGDDFKL
jgi:hypothetical protein